MAVSRVRLKKRAIMAAALFLLVSQSPHVSSALQAVWQTTTLISVRRHYLTWPSLETKYFQLRYLPGDQVLAEKLGKGLPRSFFFCVCCLSFPVKEQGESVMMQVGRGEWKLWR
ncbi:MAG: hypothetical protein M1551_05655 [Firmicutes bacterium]|nr:hypothetical protein [Bacillota bacterium]